MRITKEAGSQGDNPQFLAMDRNQQQQAVKNLLGGLSRDDQEWDVNRRNRAIEFLEMVDFEHLDSGKLLENYLKAVMTQTKDSDPYGSIGSLLEAGEIMSNFFPSGEDSAKRIENAWGNVAKTFKGVDGAYVQDLIEHIAENVVLGVSPHKGKVVNIADYRHLR